MESVCQCLDRNIYIEIQCIPSDRINCEYLAEIAVGICGGGEHYPNWPLRVIHNYP